MRLGSTFMNLNHFSLIVWASSRFFSRPVDKYVNVAIWLKLIARLLCLYGNEVNKQLNSFGLVTCHAYGGITFMIHFAPWRTASRGEEKFLLANQREWIQGLRIIPLVLFLFSRKFHIIVKESLGVRACVPCAKRETPTENKKEFSLFNCKKKT